MHRIPFTVLYLIMFQMYSHRLKKCLCRLASLQKFIHRFLRNFQDRSNLIKGTTDKRMMLQLGSSGPLSAAINFLLNFERFG